MRIKIDIRNEGEKYFISLDGSIDYSNADEFDVKVKKILPSANSILIDMEKLEYISSAGLRVIIYAFNDLENKGGLKVKNLNEAVKEIFEVTGLESLIEK